VFIGCSRRDRSWSLNRQAVVPADGRLRMGRVHPWTRIQIFCSAFGTAQPCNADREQEVVCARADDADLSPDLPLPTYHGKRCLIVEGHEPTRHLLRFVTERMGMTTEVACEWEEAFAIALAAHQAERPFGECWPMSSTRILTRRAQTSAPLMPSCQRLARSRCSASSVSAVSRPRRWSSRACASLLLVR
jgi:hypothetical protein